MKTALIHRRQQFTQSIRRTHISSLMRQRRCLLIAASDQPIIKSSLSLLTLQHHLQSSIPTANTDLIAESLIHLASILNTNTISPTDLFSSGLIDLVVHVASEPFCNLLNTQSLMTIKNKCLFIISKLSKYPQLNTQVINRLSLLEFVISQLQLSNPLKLRTILNFFSNVITIPQINLQTHHLKIPQRILSSIETHSKWKEQLTPVLLMYFKNVLLCAQRDGIEVIVGEEMLEVALLVLEACTEYQRDPEREMVLLDALLVLKVGGEGKEVGLRMDPIERVIRSRVFSQRVICCALELLCLQIQSLDPQFLLCTSSLLQTLMQLSQFPPYRSTCYQIFTIYSRHLSLHPILQPICQFIAVKLMSEASPELWHYVFSYFQANSFTINRNWEQRFVEMLSDSLEPWRDERELWMWLRLVEGSLGGQEEEGSRVVVPRWVLEEEEGEYGGSTAAEREEVREYLRRVMEQVYY